MATKTETIEINDQFKRALNILENTAKHVFITGRAGTGKSTLLEYFRNHTKKKVAVLAPTGVAALNVNGQTIHSFCRFKPDVTLQKVRKITGPDGELFKAIDTIIIDEISMVRSDLLDCVDKFLRLNGKSRANPFGGAQMAFIGDLYQLPPVVTGREMEIFRTQYKSQYFFDANAFDAFNVGFVELEKIYRQKDDKFIGLLNSIRNKSVSDSELAEINKRLNPSFEPHPDDFYINLTTTNLLSNDINNYELSKIKSKLYTFTGKIRGNFDKYYLPTEIDLKVKVGSQIMLLNNDTAKRWVNGTVGKILSIEEDDERGGHKIIVERSEGSNVTVTPFTWKLSSLFYNKETASLDSETIGSFTQYPLKLAWSVTIHKGQGKTFDKVIIDIGRGAFTHGQVYVALSRCTSLDGIVLKKPIEKKHIWMDWRVVKFLTKYQYQLSESKLSLDEKIKIIEKAIQTKSKLDIVYLKSNDVKSKRIIQPSFVGEMEYQGRSYMGVEGYCFERQDDRVFRVDRILEMNLVEE